LTAVTAKDTHRVPDAPRIGQAIRDALSDFYFNSWRLVPANAAWGIGLILVVGLILVWPLGSLIMVILLGLPTAGIYRLAALIVRDRPVAFSDALSAWREFLRPALLLAAGLVGITIALSVNLAVGLTSTDPIAWAVGTLAAWGLLATWTVALLVWPLVVDPLRDGQSLLQRLQLASTLLLLSPIRVAAMVLLMSAVLVVSAILFAALLTVSIAFIALVTTRYVLPAADRVEGRKTKLVPG
jgi:uncharacterized membrane protein YesL